MTNTDNLTEQHEQAFEDLDQKVVLVEILAELQQIRMALSDGARGAQSDTTNEVVYRCTKCDKIVPADKRERHARGEHKAPPDMMGQMFEEVEG